MFKALIHVITKLDSRWNLWFSSNWVSVLSWVLDLFHAWAQILAWMVVLLWAWHITWATQICSTTVWVVWLLLMWCLYRNVLVCEADKRWVHNSRVSKWVSVHWACSWLLMFTSIGISVWWSLLSRLSTVIWLESRSWLTQRCLWSKLWWHWSRFVIFWAKHKSVWVLEVRLNLLLNIISRQVQVFVHSQESTCWILLNLQPIWTNLCQSDYLSFKVI